MSLGFNHNRKYTSSTLPGAVTPMVIRENRSRTSMVTAAMRKKSPPTPAPTKRTVLPPVAPHVQPHMSHQTTIDEMHTVYATVAVPLVNEADGTVVASTGDRVVLVYPMSSDADDGRITMNLKSVNPNTARLSYTVVTVYDPNTEIRYVTKFSLIP